MSAKRRPDKEFDATWDIGPGITVRRCGVQFARESAHKAFDKLWKDGHMSRGAAYRWLQDELGLDRKRGHIRHLTIAQCRQLIYLCQSRKGEGNDN